MRFVRFCSFLTVNLLFIALFLLYLRLFFNHAFLRLVTKSFFAKIIILLWHVYKGLTAVVARLFLSE